MRPVCKFAQMLQIYFRLNALRKKVSLLQLTYVLTRASLNFLADGLSNKSIDDGNKNTKVVTKLKEKEKHFYMLIFLKIFPYCSQLSKIRSLVQQKFGASDCNKISDPPSLGLLSLSRLLLGT